ncbi:MAG: prepilin-type N-terminal cleavage/methylation domain-containing protein [Oscillospiraceae bacterium]|nr:prepilin-type N-terminal cleavage/methylation domain-containing protein [Oscillospiraceae bacterium]
MRRFKRPKLRHPWAKSAAGFTLIELIVVIAIIAILACLCAVGYGGYVKSANKKSDMFLVGNIMRAIEICTNASTLVDDDAGALAATVYPVGAIVLSNTEDCRVYASVLDIGSAGTPGSAPGSATGGTPTPRCVIKKLDKPLVTNYSLVKHCDNTAAENVLDKLGLSPPKIFYVYGNLTFASDADMYYCATHTTLPETRTYYTEYKEDTQFDISSVQQVTYYECIGDEQTAYFTEDMTGIYTFVDDHTDGATLSNTTTETTFDTPSETPSLSGVSVAGEGNALYDAIAMAFGDVASLKLAYDKWGEEEPNDFDYSGNYADEIAAFYNSLSSGLDKNVITILVGVENDEVHFAVSPSSANPRKN